jgi:hypothetical protein
MDMPDARRTDVLRRGTSKGSSGLMPVGQQPPSSGVGQGLSGKRLRKIQRRRILLKR